MQACRFGRPTVARALLDKGADATITDVHGWNALHWAAYGGSVACAKVLLDARVELLNVKNEYGYTALDIAVISNKRECGEYLRSRGAECNSQTYPSDWKVKCLIF
jgi:ankyrin repeat protein